MTFEIVSPEPLDPQLAHQLDIQTRQINRVVERYDGDAAVVGGQIGGSSVTFDVRSKIALGLERLRDLQHDLLAALRAGEVGFSRGRDGWQLRLSRPEDPPVPLLRLLSSAGPLPRATAAIGLSMAGNPILLRFAASEVTHVLISGDASAGKTTLLRTIAVGLALTNRQSELQLLVIEGEENPADPGVLAQESLLYPLSYLPHLLTDPVSGADTAGEVLRFMAGEMDYRRQHRVRRPVIVVLIDHLATLLEAAEEKVADDLIRLLQYGPSAGIHVVAATSRPASEAIDVMMRSNMPVRLVGYTLDSETARRVTGIRNAGTEHLAGGGDFLAIADDEVARFQAADINDYDLHFELTQLYDPSRPRLLARSWSERPRMKPKATPPPEQPAMKFTARPPVAQEPEYRSEQESVRSVAKESKAVQRPQPVKRPEQLPDQSGQSSETLPF